MRKITSIAEIQQRSFSAISGLNKHAESGLYLTPIGDISDAQLVGIMSPVEIYNGSGAVAFIAFGAQNMDAPTGPTDGRPINAGERIMMNSGPNRYVRASSTGVFGYAFVDD